MVAIFSTCIDAFGPYVRYHCFILSEILQE